MHHSFNKSVANRSAINKTHGFTLVELMTAVAIIAILSVFAVPAYQSYVGDSELGVVTTNIYTMEMFQEDYMMRNGEYANNLADLDEIEEEIGWRPKTQDGITYSIAAGDRTTYDVTAISPGGMEVCITFPGRDPCDP